MTKKYHIIAEQIFRVAVDATIDLDELRKEDRFKGMTDEEILLDYAIEDRSGVFDGHNDWSLEENNVRSIYDENGEEIYID